jgi:NADH:ubiquinone oxidoreductase subunit K
VLFALAITVAEVAVGLALVLLLYRRHGDTLLDMASEAKG